MPGTEERLKNCPLVIVVGDAINRFEIILHELEGFNMGSNRVGWHAASTGGEHGQSNDNPVVASTGIVVEPRDVGFADVTEVCGELCQHDGIHGGVEWDRAMLTGME